MQKIFIILALSGVLSSCGGDLLNKKIEKRNLADLVNPLVGTESTFKLSHGNTYPAVATPWGMNFGPHKPVKWGMDGDIYSADSIRGIKQTHQPSPWINDYGAFSLMPLTGDLKWDQFSRASKFSHQKEISRPDYYYVFLEDYQISAEVTPSERGSVFRFTFPESGLSWVILDAFHKGSSVKIDRDSKTLSGFAKNNSGGVPENFANYFIARFDIPFDTVVLISDGIIHPDSLSVEGYHTLAAVGFKTSKGHAATVRVASSFISHNQAVINLNREIGEKTFEEVRQTATDWWNEMLNRVQVDGGTPEQQRTFYAALYRTLLFPRKFYEFDADNQVMHYSPYNGQVLPGYLYTDNGFWDTFRAVFPFFSLVYPDHTARVMEGLVNTYLESGWLPEWASPGHRNCMIGSNSASIVADAYLKGIRGFNIDILYEAILKNSENEGPMHSVGRYGVEYYNQLGYIPFDAGINENAARTLEYAYADFTIWKLAQALDRPQDEVDRFRKRAMNYQNLFDPSTNFMRGKNKDGSWQSPFVPEAWGGAFTEGSSWHYTWSVFQDPQGLINPMGGDSAFVAKLDSVFSMPPIFDFTYYGYQIHEITEMVLGDMGQYAHGNQPIQHAIYLYNYAGTPWKAQTKVREVMNKLYSDQPDGLCGDEDNGQTSAWYVFSAMGFYPVCPGSNEYVVGSPLFDEVRLNLENGNRFIIEARNNSTENVYIRSARLNAFPWNRNYITHDRIRKGGRVVFEMDSQPSKKRGTALKDRPYSMSK